MFYILQEEKNDCGFTCLKSLLATVNKDSHYLYLANPKEEGEVYSFYDLIEYTDKMGFKLEAYNVTDKENIELKNKQPILVSTNLVNRAHMVMVYKISKRYVYYLDPSIGKKKMKKEEFISIWDGRALVLENFEMKKCKERRKPLINKKEEVLMDILEILACLSITSGLLFIGEQYPFFLPIIMFSLFAIFEILLRSYMIHVFNNIDKRTYNDSLKVKEGRFKEFYTTLEEDKRYEVSINLSSIYAVMSVIVISLILASHGGYSLYYLLFSMLFALIEVLFIEPYMARKNQEIQELENNITDGDLGLVHIIHQKAYRFAKITLLYRYVVFGMTLLGIVLIMALSGVISISYIIFYLCLNVFFYKSLVSGLGMNGHIKKHRQLRVHLINLCDK